MKYFYIHGLNSTGEKTIKELSRVLETKVIGLDWKTELCYRTNVENMQEQIESYGEDDFVIIGSSMGGFYARILSNVLKVPCVLFNPVTDVRKAYENIKDIEFYSNLSKELVNSYDLAMISDITIPRLVVIGLNDTVINPNDTIETWKGRCNLITVDEGHQIENFEPFKEAIEHLSIPLLYDAI